MSPTIFNVVVDAVICHWVTVVATKEAGAEGLGMSIQARVAYLYANDGIFALTQLDRLKRVFDVLADLFDRVGLHKNKGKTVSMAFQPCHTPGRMSEVAYEKRATGTGLTYQERQRMLVQFPECILEVATGSLLMQHQSEHGLGEGYQGGAAPPLPGRIKTREHCCDAGSQQRGAWAGRQTGPISGFTLCTATSGIQL